jgi:hypothetical protein
MEVLKFIFQDFWHWLGSVVLLSIIMSPLITFCAVKGEKE